MACAKRTIVRSRGGDLQEQILQACENPDTEAPWIDIKRNKSITRERGRGSAYQKTVYNYTPQCEDTSRTYENTLDIANPNDASQIISYNKNISGVVVGSGRGFYYQGTHIQYCNNGDNESRSVRTKRVTNPDTGDFLDVERIDRYTVLHGRGFHYQAKAVYPKTQDEDLIDECPT